MAAVVVEVQVALDGKLEVRRLDVKVGEVEVPVQPERRLLDRLLLRLDLFGLAARRVRPLAGVEEQHVRVLAQAGQLLVGKLLDDHPGVGDLRVHGEQAVGVVAEDVQLSGDVGALLARLPHRHRSGPQRLAVLQLAVAHRLAVAQMHLAGELDLLAAGRLRRVFAGGHQNGREGSHAGAAGEAIDDHFLARKRRVEADVLVDALPDHVEDAAAQVGLAFGDGLGDAARQLHVRVEHAAGAAQAGRESREEGEVEMLCLQVAAHRSVEDGGHSVAQQRACAQVGFQAGVGEEVAAAGRVDADVQQRAGRVRLHIQVGRAQVLVAGGDVLDGDLPHQPRLRGRAGQRDAAGELSLRHRAAPGELACARDGQARNLQRRGDRAVEQRRDGVGLAAARPQREELLAREREAGIEPRHHQILRLRAERQLDRVGDDQLALETEAMQAPDGDVLSSGIDLQRRVCDRAGQPHAEVHLARAALGKEARLRQPPELELRHRQFRLERPLQGGAQIRLVLEGALQVKRRLRGEAQRRRSAERDGAIDRGLALLEEQAQPRVDVLDLLRADVVRIDRQRRPRRTERAARDQVQVDQPVRALLLQLGDLRGLGELRQIDL